MKRYITTSNWFFGGIVCLLITAGLCYLWYNHSIEPYKQAASELTQQVRQSENTQRADTNVIEQAADVPVTKTKEPRKTTLFSTKKQTKMTDTVVNKIESKSTVLSETQNKFHVSPFGLGPYPKIPEEWNEPNLWDITTSLNEELLERVCIKMWNEGKRYDGIGIDANGLIHPIIQGTVYVKWGENAEGKYIIRFLGHPDDFPPEGAPYRYQQKNDFPPGIKILDWYFDAIDPYEYLNL